MTEAETTDAQFLKQTTDKAKDALELLKSCDNRPFEGPAYPAFQNRLNDAIATIELFINVSHKAQQIAEMAEKSGVSLAEPTVPTTTTTTPQPPVTASTYGVAKFDEPDEELPPIGGHLSTSQILQKLYIIKDEISVLAGDFGGPPQRAAAQNAINAIALLIVRIKEIPDAKAA